VRSIVAFLKLLEYTDIKSSFSVFLVGVLA
jgi:hypothetical protein